MTKFKLALLDTFLGVLFLVGIAGLALLVVEIAKTAPFWVHTLNALLSTLFVAGAILVVGRSIRERL